MHNKTYAYINLSLAMIIVGSSVVFGKMITNAFPVFLASGLRFGIASAMMLPILLKYEKNLFQISAKDFINLFAMAFCGQFVFTVLVLLGLRYTSAIEAGIITSTTPAMMAAVTYLLFREKPGVRILLGIFMVVAGIVIVNGFADAAATSVQAPHVFGNMLMMGAVAGEAFFLLFRKRISSHISNLALTGYLCFLGFILFLPLSLMQALSFDFRSVSPLAWGAILYFGAVFTVLAYLFWFQGVARVSGNTAGVFTALMPVSAVLLSCIFLKEALTGYHILGGTLIIVAILLITVKKQGCLGE